MGIRYVTNHDDAAEVTRALEGVDSIALDCEAAGFHRYSDRLCLIQLTTPSATFLLDTLAFDPAEILAPVLTPTGREVVMHGADFDVRLLDRDLGLRIRGLFDTQIAASLLGVSSPGLSNLLKKFLGVELSKKYQRADWAERPLPEEMLRYAADDTHHLHELRGILAERLQEAGRTDWAEEEFRLQEEIRFEDNTPADPVLRVRAARDLSTRDVALLRTALEWRDATAQKLDRAPFRVAGDDVLLRVVEARPRSVDELSEIRGFSGSVAGREGADLVRRIGEIARAPEEDLLPYPPTPSNGRGERPSPEEEDRMRRLKGVRNRAAGELGIEKGVLLPNHLLQEIAARAPGDRSSLLDVPGVRKWQVEVLGRTLLAEV